MHFSIALGSTSKNFATGAIPGMSGVSTFSIGGTSTVPCSAPRGPPCGFHVGGVVARPAPHEVVLADRRDGHELVVHVAADLTRLRFDRAERQAATHEDAVVRLVHLAVALAQPVEVGVEGVRVLHQELTAAQQPEARAQLVAVLPVDLVQVDGQVSVRRELLRDDRRHHLLGRRREAEAGLLAIEQAEHERAVRRVAPGALPQFAGLEDREERLLRARPVHLLAHDLLDLAQDPVAERQPRVDAGRHPADEPGPDEQPVAVDFGIGGIVTQGAQEQLRHPHGSDRTQGMRMSV